MRSNLCILYSDFSPLAPELIYLPPVFFLIALTYATAGFGGGSSYLAVLALAALPTGEMRATALVCNLIVAGGGVFHFWKAGAMPWQRALPLVLISVPAAYLGGRIELPREQFLGLLGLVLLFAGLAMWLRPGAEREPLADDPLPEAARRTQLQAGILGGALGFLAGLVSIGGGIFLSPVLFLQRWAEARTIAAVTSLFIFVNSLSGLLGQVSRGFEPPWQLLGVLAVAVLIGGQIGTRLTLRSLSATTIRRVAAVLIIVVGARLLVQVSGLW
ncbi:sulfite exporter TauE/SafE family protein [Neolewinella aurantiaca]|uniref:Probable membrane transporter protein n=1 Tax=Neolewinella aurantiaca TaxID=2602767 RepID=A0A5C7FVR5_9BACT|nr:sulfite exporter TauE/SafE family protein [Neolewinella aurantiaca]TXF90737.1 sulfite exporter TauE/SafE family protein [Neolewinella aurantiaca]